MNLLTPLVIIVSPYDLHPTMAFIYELNFQYICMIFILFWLFGACPNLVDSLSLPLIENYRKIKENYKSLESNYRVEKRDDLFSLLILLDRWQQWKSSGISVDDPNVTLTDFSSTKLYPEKKQRLLKRNSFCFFGFSIAGFLDLFLFWISGYLDGGRGGEFEALHTLSLILGTFSFSPSALLSSLLF